MKWSDRESRELVKDYLDHDSDDLVWWTWGVVFGGDTWLIGTDVLDKFIDSHKEEQNE